MADEKISGLTPVPLPLEGADEVAIVRTALADTAKGTMADVATFVENSIPAPNRCSIYVQENAVNTVFADNVTPVDIVGTSVLTPLSSGFTMPSDGVIKSTVAETYLAKLTFTLTNKGILTGADNIQLSLYKNGVLIPGSNSVNTEGGNADMGCCISEQLTEIALDDEFKGMLLRRVGNNDVLALHYTFISVPV